MDVLFNSDVYLSFRLNVRLSYLFRHVSHYQTVLSSVWILRKKYNFTQFFRSQLANFAPYHCAVKN